MADHGEQSHAKKVCNLEETEKFIQASELLRLSFEEIKNMRRPIITNETESVIKNFPTKRKDQHHMVSLIKSTKQLKRNILLTNIFNFVSIFLIFTISDSVWSYNFLMYICYNSKQVLLIYISSIQPNKQNC